jgi:hypothetical protein
MQRGAEMRAIKFRAKMVDDSRWVYGGGVWTFERGSALFGEDKNGNPVVHSINPETVGQFTGLHDRNDKEIYEGDVVKTGRSTFRVFWENAQFKAYDLLTKRWAYSLESLYAIGTQYDVIGNIYENQELSKETP